MSQDNRHFKLGLFVLITLAIFVVGVVLFGGGELFKAMIQLETSVTESVSGLVIGADVKFQGVTIGKVNYIQLGGTRVRDTDSDERRVELARLIIIGMQLDPDMVPQRFMRDARASLETGVKKGLRVQMASSGITGPTYLELVVLNEGEFKPQQPPYLCEHIYIPSTPSFVTRLKSELEQFVSELNRMKLPEAVDSAKALLDDLRVTVNEVQIDKLRGSLVKTIEDAGAAARQVNDLLRSPEIASSLKNIEGATANARDLAGSPEVRKFFADLPAISAKIDSIVAHVDKMVSNPALNKAIDGTANLGPAVTELKRALREFSDILASNRSDIDSMLTNLRRTSVNAAELTDDAKRNPSRVLFGDAPPKTDR